VRIERAVLAGVLALAACGGGTVASQPDLGNPDLLAPSCSGQAGDQHSVAFESGGETRYYFLHVPAAYGCAEAWPLLVDFHGTGSGVATDPVEESWAFDEMIAAADAGGFLVVRPRSRSRDIGGVNIFQWDINGGDQDRNRTFATELIADLETRYHIDPQRVYAAGFSNGPSQALEFLQNDPPLVHGYMVVEGGLNRAISTKKKLTAADGRIYVTVGYRDYIWSATRMLWSFLGSHGFDMSNLWQREADTGHELYGWHYAEAFAWIDRGERPSSGTLASGWQRETMPDAASITAFARDPAGLVHATATGGIYRRAADATWTRTATLPASTLPAHLESLCFLADGTGIAVGEAAVYGTTDGLSWSLAKPVTETHVDQGFGGAYINAVACSATTITAGGLWTAESSVDGGKTWASASMSVDTQGDQAFVAALRRSASGTWMASGYYDYLARSTDGITFTPLEGALTVQWWNDLVPDDAGGWWVVGEKGAVQHSSDDGLTFAAVTVPTSEDLYAASFRDADRGILVGSHGAAYVTSDGGATWTDVSTGLDGYLGAATWIDANTVLVAGEHGTVLRRTL
jgi:predicted esterase/photosystem II stability/assembly factor-like uncharacterized protein